MLTSLLVLSMPIDLRSFFCLLSTFWTTDPHVSSWRSCKRNLPRLSWSTGVLLYSLYHLLRAYTRDVRISVISTGPRSQALPASGFKHFSLVPRPFPLQVFAYSIRVWWDRSALRRSIRCGTAVSPHFVYTQHVDLINLRNLFLCIPVCKQVILRKQKQVSNKNGSVHFLKWSVSDSCPVSQGRCYKKRLIIITSS